MFAVKTARIAFVRERLAGTRTSVQADGSEMSERILASLLAQ